MRFGRARLLASIAAITTLAGALAAAAIPSASAVTAAPAALTASTAPPLPAGATRLGALPARATISFDVALNLGNEAGLDALVNGLANPKSRYFRDFLAKGQFGPVFGLPLAQIAQVENALRALGLDPGPADAARLQIPVTATAGAIDRAFGLTLVAYRLPGGRVAYANSAAPRIPAAIAPYVEGVLGLDNVYLNQPADLRLPASAASSTGPAATAAAAGPGSSAAAGGGVLPAPRLTAPAGVSKPCTAVTDAAAALNGYTADQFASHYEMSTLYDMGDLGQGVHVAVAELEPNLPSDISAYESCYGITTPVNYVTVGAGVGTGKGSGEAALDIENITGLAPGASIDVYQAANTAVTALLDIATRVLDTDTDRVLSISWGLCESEAGSALLAHYQTVFKALNAEGITVVAASGDYGPTGCYLPTQKKPNRTLSPVSPATSNYVISVGGTNIKTAAPLSSETAWNGGANKRNTGAGGGGVSVLCMPSYQDQNQNDPADLPITGMINKYSRRSGPCVNHSGDRHGYLREVPDLSADASGTSPYVMYWSGAWYGFYGTSASTTLLAAEAALIDASAYCSPLGWDSGPAGLLPEGVYGIVTANDFTLYFPRKPFVVHDITSGNTDYRRTGYRGGRYPATKGYDLATGLGAPLLTGTTQPATLDPGMASVLCHWFAAPGLASVSTRSVFPSSGKAGRPITVTVHGTGMVAVPYTDAAWLNTANNARELTEVWAFCSSHTTCRVTLPAMKAGTYQIELNAVGFLPCSRGCKASVEFRFAGVPHITRISPARGHHGTRVTIRGRQFIGVSGVWFGGRKGMSVRVISASKLTVVAPPGSGAVNVKVIAAGGTSNTARFTY